MVAQKPEGGSLGRMGRRESWNSLQGVVFQMGGQERNTRGNKVASRIHVEVVDVYSLRLGESNAGGEQAASCEEHRCIWDLGHS